MIDEKIIEHRNLGEKIEFLNSCNWNERIGEKIDVFWLANEHGNFFGHVYEYIMDCDNLRLIYWYLDPQGLGKIIDFMIEDLEEESMFVIEKDRHLKNREIFQKHFNNSHEK